MNERERLVELMKESVKNCDPGTSCLHCRYRTQTDCMERITADYMIAHGVTVQEWIPVKERLPESTRLCIASKYNVPFLAWWTGKDWRAADTVTVVDGINYWTELPKPPEEEV